MRFAVLTIWLLLPGGSLLAQTDFAPRIQPLDSVPELQYRYIPPSQKPWLNQRDTSQITYSEWDNMPILRPKMVEPMPGAFPQPAPQLQERMAPMPNPMHPRRRDSTEEKPIH
ncbi:hypothetical protein [Telluribacter humicola]|uniref:hypothetical protein n=1 Tax=Telluribacter humicola TaxID=1720261 RepID=UPI001A95A25F|nr:hypothetical protein [Telluribacter humicola]